MILLMIEVLCIFILAMILSTLIIDERKNRAAAMKLVKLRGYWNGHERRNFDRLNIVLEVKYYVNGKPIKVKSWDISTKGIRLILDEKFEKRIPLRLEIKLPNNNRMIKTSGEVVWSQESMEKEKNSARRLFNTGIKFFKLRANDEKTLFDFIHNLQPQER